MADSAPSRASTSSWFVKTVRSGARDEQGNLPPKVWRQGGVSPTLSTFDNNSESRATVLAVSLRGREGGAVPEVHGDGSTVGALRAASGGSSRDYVSVTGQGVVHTLTGEGHDASEDGTGRGTPIVAFSHTAGIDAQASTEVAPSVLAGNDRMPAVATTTVRRLTPRECERLMGWPDDHTRYRLGPGCEPVEQADSHRYKQCGNGMAAPVVEWIARRIVEVDPMTPEDDPTLFQCALCDQWRDVAERIPDRTDHGPGDWCDDCAAKPWGVT